MDGQFCLRFCFLSPCLSILLIVQDPSAVSLPSQLKIRARSMRGDPSDVECALPVTCGQDVRVPLAQLLPGTEYEIEGTLIGSRLSVFSPVSAFWHHELCGWLVPFF